MLTETFGDLGNPKYREYARHINSSGAHLLQIINDILDLCKIEAGKMELIEESLGLRQIIANSVQLVSEKAKEHGIVISVEIAENVPNVRADERKIKQALINILSNAVKFTPAGGKLTVASRIENDGKLAISISDTGLGISPENQEQIFNPFVQVDSGLSRKFDGTGLGLPLSKAMVELHGGTLDLESAVGVGTTVTIRLPHDRLGDDPPSV